MAEIDNDARTVVDKHPISGPGDQRSRRPGGAVGDCATAVQPDAEFACSWIVPKFVTVPAPAKTLMASPPLPPMMRPAVDPLRPFATRPPSSKTTPLLPVIVPKLVTVPTP
jgi:hypothetical protein